MTMPILPGVDGVQKMSKSLANHIGVADAAEEQFGRTMSIPDAVAGGVVPPPRAATSPRRPGIPGRTSAGWRRLIADRFHGPGAGAAGRGALQPGGARPRDARRVPEVPVPAGTVHLPALLVDGLGDRLAQRGAAPDRRGRGQPRRRARDAPSTSTSADLAGRVLKAGKRRFARLRPRPDPVGRQAAISRSRASLDSPFEGAILPRPLGGQRVPPAWKKEPIETPPLRPSSNGDARVRGALCARAGSLRRNGGREDGNRSDLTAASAGVSILEN